MTASPVFKCVQGSLKHTVSMRAGQCTVSLIKHVFGLHIFIFNEENLIMNKYIHVKSWRDSKHLIGLENNVC